MKYNDNGEYKDIYIKSFDTLPVGTEVDYDGETVPSGWTEVDDILWENENPTQAFPSQNITLSSDDYNYLEIYYWRTTTQKLEKSIKIRKGSNFTIIDFATAGNTYSWMRDRTFTRTDDTHYSVGICYLQFANSNSRTEETTGLIPLLIIGHK